MDATKLGSKIKDGKNQKTVLSIDDINMIQNNFISREIIEDFSVEIDVEDLEKKNYSFSAGQYFDIKINYESYTKDEFAAEIYEKKEQLRNLFNSNYQLESTIIKSLGELEYHEN